MLLYYQHTCLMVAIIILLFGYSFSFLPLVPFLFSTSLPFYCNVNVQFIITQDCWVCDTSKLAKKSKHMNNNIMEATQINLHCNKINKEDGFSLSRSWKPIYSHPERTRRKLPSRTSLPLDSTFLPGLQNGHFFSILTEPTYLVP